MGLSFSFADGSSNFAQRHIGSAKHPQVTRMDTFCLHDLG